MLKSDESKFIAIFYVMAFIPVCICVVAILDNNYDFSGKQERERLHLLQVQDQGEQAAKLGVSSEANPYQGVRYHVDESNAWLNGWMRVKKRSK